MTQHCPSEILWRELSLIRQELLRRQSNPTVYMVGSHLTYARVMQDLRIHTTPTPDDLRGITKRTFAGQRYYVDDTKPHLWVVIYYFNPTFGGCPFAPVFLGPAPEW